MIFSELAKAILISPNSSVRGHAIDRITIHHMAGNLSVGACGAGFANPARRASANYGIDSAGNVGLYVPETRRAWTSSNRANDDRAITVEVANCSGAPNWPVSTLAYSQLIALCTDICRRYGKTKMVWLPDSAERKAYEPGPEEMGMTVHQDFAATTCPGPWLMSRMPDIAAEVTKRLTAPTEEDVKMKRYNTVEELPDWGRPTAEKLLASGLLKGRDTGLDLSDDMLRCLVILDRAGAFDGRERE